MPIGLISNGAIRAASGEMTLDAVREWVCAFADQTTEHAILLLDRDLTVLWTNRATTAILNADQSAIVGRPVHAFFTPEDLDLGIPEHEAAVATSRGASEDDRWMKRADGSIFWATGRTVALRDVDGSGVGFLKIFHDQTEVRMRMSTLRNRADALKKAENVRIAAIATLCHELRNPLSVVGLYAALIEKQSSDPEAASHFEAIRENLGFIARMVDDLDHASRETTAKLAVRTEPLVLQDVIYAAIETALERAGRPLRIVERLFPPGRPIRLQGDRLRLHQVFVNLLGNAIKFTGDGGRIWVRATVEAAQAVVRVEDDGIGIDPQLLENIFDMFVQAPSATGNEGGMGIGLALVKDLVELHGGTVQARSEGLGRGAEFVVRVPLSLTGASPGESAADAMGSGPRNER